MGGRRDDRGPGRGPLPPVPQRPDVVRSSPAAGTPPVPTSRPAVDRPAVEWAPVDRGGVEVQDLTDRPSPASRSRRLWLVVGLVLAAGATLAVFFTDDPLYLRVALLAVCWAFVIAAFLAGGRRADQVVAAGREAELRHAYDLELEREVAARHEHQGELEGQLRREAEQAMRGELTQLRTELAGLSELKEDLAAVSRLRGDLAALGQLRTELAALTELRGELTGLGQLRAELTGLGELRADLGRMRSELTEQLSGELLIERMVMRAQSVRGPAQPAADGGDGRTLQGGTTWEPPAPARPGSWDVDRWESTRVDLAAPVPEPAPRVIAPPSTPAAPPVPEPTAFARVDGDAAAGHRPPSPREWLIEESVLEPGVQPGPPSPRGWLGDGALPDGALADGALPDGALADGALADGALADGALADQLGRPTGELPAVPALSRPWASDAPPVPEPSPRRHRRAAEPDDDTAPSTGYRRSHPEHEETAVAAAPEPSWSSWAPVAGSASETTASSPSDVPSWQTPVSSSALDRPSWETPSGSSALDTPSWGTAAGSSSDLSSRESTSAGSSALGRPSWQTSSGGSSYETPSWETSTTSSSYGTPSYEPPSDRTPSYEAPSYEAPSYEAPSYGTPSYEAPSSGTSSWASSGSAGSSDERSSYGTPATETPRVDLPSWEAAGSSAPTPSGDLWVSPSSDQAGAGPAATGWSTSGAAGADQAGNDPAPRAEPPLRGHARLEQILAESGVDAPSGGRSRRRRYRGEGEGAGDDVLARVLGRE